jgi:hypothetical protein
MKTYLRYLIEYYAGLFAKLEITSSLMPEPVPVPRNIGNPKVTNGRWR